ncbi:MAG: C1 family peptidase, partial [Crenarchaeota archaeon]|nr:C1 family peptidase [Thermoproteota archaeon]
MKKKIRCSSLLVLALLIFSLISSLQISVGSITENSLSLSANNSTFYDQEIPENLVSKTLMQLKNSFGVYEEEKNYNNIIYGHGTGLVPPTEEEWLTIAQNMQVLAPLTSSEVLPSSVDLSETVWFPPIGDQAHQGSCSSWAVGYYTKTFQEAKEHSWDLSDAKWVDDAPSLEYQDKIISPSFIYNLINDGVDEGSSLEKPIRLICDVGAASWKQMPYSDEDLITWPSEDAWLEAATYRGNKTSGYTYIYTNSDEGIETLKTLLASQNLAVTAVDAYKFSTFTDNDVLTADLYVNVSLNHAATIVGYDDNITYIENGQLTQGAFKIANSWGVDEPHANMTHWENILDGFYWISYETMKQQVGWAIYYEDIIDYQPSLFAKITIDHLLRNEVSITVGYGSSTSPIETKVFCDYTGRNDSKPGYVFGGNQSFDLYTIIYDITELKENTTGIYYQPFFLKIYDSGTQTIGNITYFSIQDSECKTLPVQTKNGQDVYLSVNHSFALPSFSLSPTSGIPLSIVTFDGIGFTPEGFVSLFYMHPITCDWIVIDEEIFVSSMASFNYTFSMPALNIDNLPGDNPALFDEITFKVHDFSENFTCTGNETYTQWRRGIKQIGNNLAVGLFGNNTDLASKLLVQNNQSIILAGQRFSPGSTEFLWDNSLLLDTMIIDNSGSFVKTLTIPTTFAGEHTISIENGGASFLINLTRLPWITSNFTSQQWLTSDYIINLYVDLDDAEIFYKINDNEICSVNIDGQPKISVESIDNTLEYWAIW